jgi:hypothetical protein
MATEAHLEKLNQEHQALLYLGGFLTAADGRGWVRQSSILLDACIDAGMSFDEPDHREWASRRLGEWLCSGPLELAA